MPFLVLLLFPLCLPATPQSLLYDDDFSDRDLDGIADTADHCPNTPILESVDQHGCSTALHLTAGLGVSLTSEQYQTGVRYTARKSNLMLQFETQEWFIGFGSGYYHSLEYDDSNISQTLRGLSDSYLLAGYRTPLFSSDGFLTADLYLKLPTAATTIGTGEFDYGGYLGWEQHYQAVILTLSLGYIVNTDTATIPLKNTFLQGVQAGYALTPDTYLSLGYQHENARLAEESGIDTFNGSINRQVAESYTLRLYLSYGENEAGSYPLYALDLFYRF